MSRGIVYITTGREFYEEAKISARSVKNEMPDIPIAIMTDVDVDSDLFDEVIEIENPRNDFSDRVFNLERSPFDRNLFLDTDIYVEHDISDVFEVLDEFDFAATHDAIREFYVPLEDVPEAFPQYNGGFLAYKMNDEVKQFFENYKELYREGNDVYTGDQPMLRKALYKSNLRIATLPTEYNCRYVFPGFIEGKAKVFHGRLKDIETLGMEKKAEVTEAVDRINAEEYPRVHYLDRGRVKVEKNNPPIKKQLKKALSEYGVKTTVEKGFRKLVNNARGY